MLSLDKQRVWRICRNGWETRRTAVLKMDGLTIVLTYEEEPCKGGYQETGEIGEVITPNARVFANIR